MYMAARADVSARSTLTAGPARPTRAAPYRRFGLLGGGEGGGGPPPQPAPGGVNRPCGGWAARQDSQGGCCYCGGDLHAMSEPWDPKALAEGVRRTAATLVAVGIDPERSVLFVQSDVPEHTELAWILTCLARMGELGRMTQFKDKSRGGESASIGVGLYLYPVLMAADVLAYPADLVPVGDDQRQHLELMRDLAARFNSRFGETFPRPEARI